MKSLTERISEYNKHVENISKQPRNDGNGVEGLALSIAKHDAHDLGRLAAHWVGDDGEKLLFVWGVGEYRDSLRHIAECGVKRECGSNIVDIVGADMFCDMVGEVMAILDVACCQAADDVFMRECLLDDIE